MGKLVCIGGGEIPRIKNEIKLPYETREIDEEIVKISEKENPNFLFIGTASTNSYNYFLVIKEIFENLGCNVSNLDLLQDDLNMEEVKNSILNTDIIYVGGGNTKFMLKKWRELGVDKLLIEAYNKGIVCSGLSAGSYCWFKINYDLIEGLGIINAVNCVHYDHKDEHERYKFYNVIKETGYDGIALENCVALEIIDGRMKVIKSNNNKNAYRIIYRNNEWMEEIL